MGVRGGGLNNSVLIQQVKVVRLLRINYIDDNMNIYFTNKKVYIPIMVYWYMYIPSLSNSFQVKLHYKNCSINLFIKVQTIIIRSIEHHS
jgi:hypothetical protein